MATRRFTRRAPMRRRKAFSFKGGPLRTRSVKETKWNTSRLNTVRSFVFDFESALSVDIVVINPRLQFEITATPSAPGPVTNIGPMINVINSQRGIKVGGIVWDSGFVVQRPIQDAEDAYVVAHARVHETLWTLETNHDTGLPTEIPLIADTWRPIRTDDSPFVPGEDDGGLVRIHHTRMALLAAGNNAYGVGGQAPVDLGSPGGANATNTWNMPGWGGTRSLRLRKFITDEQSLSFNVHVVNPNPASTVQFEATWVISATIYWAFANQR